MRLSLEFGGKGTMPLNITDPTAIEISPEVALLLEDVDAELSDFVALGEFTPAVADQIRVAFLPQRLSDTLNIEGVMVNPRVTQAVLEGQALSESDRYGEREILNAIAANDHVESSAKASEYLTPHEIRQIHALVADGLVASPGTYRSTNVRITGAAFTPPDLTDVPMLIHDLCEVNHSAKEIHPILRACWLHATFGAIHPFEDGNGRTGRLVQDWVLIANRYLPVGIPASRRQEYYEALIDADRGNWMPLMSIVANSELTALERARRIADAPTQRMQWIRSLVRKSQETVEQHDFNRYELWRRRIDAVRDEFQRWTEDLNSEAADIAMIIKVWDPISFEKWQEVRERGHARGTWLFTLRLMVRGQLVYSWLFYARRHEFSYTVDYEQLETKLVGIFVTGQNEPGPRFDFGQFSDPYVSLRELLQVGDDLIAYEELSQDALDQRAAANSELAHRASEARWLGRLTRIGDVVPRFIEENLQKLGLI